MMSPDIGYLSLIQYCPNGIRMECANVGVLLFCPARDFLKARVAPDMRRAVKFLGPDNPDHVRLNLFKSGVRDRVEIEKPNLRTLAALENFISAYAGRFPLTKPRPMRVGDPQQDLDRLYAELVEDGRSAQRPKLHAYLRREFRRAGVADKVQTDVEVSVPSFQRQVTIPFGYKDERYHLIQPAKFLAPQDKDLMTTACRYAVEGRSLYDNPDPRLGPLQLVVVGNFPAGRPAGAEVVRHILSEHHVKLYTFHELDRLVSEIRERGRELVPGLFDAVPSEPRP